jgi:hypothetical protein
LQSDFHFTFLKYLNFFLRSVRYSTYNPAQIATDTLEYLPRLLILHDFEQGMAAWRANSGRSGARR